MTRRRFLLVPPSSIAIVVLAACNGGGNGRPAPAPAAPKVAGVSAGVISGKGSIIVNGVEWQKPDDRRKITKDGTVIAEDDLRVGMGVKVTGDLDDSTNGKASEIQVLPAIRYQVGTVSASGFTVLGQTVTVTSTTVLDGTDGNFAPSQPVEVHGVFTGPDQIRATYIRKCSCFDDAVVRGTISSFDGGAGTFKIGTLMVIYAGAEVVPAGTVPADGLFVEVRGLVVGGELQATRVEVEDLARDADGRKAEIEVFVASVDPDARTFNAASGAGSLRVVWDDSTEFAGGGPGDLSGAKVEAEGTLSGGSLAADRVEFEDAAGIEDTAGIEGSAESVNADTGTLRILGISVQVSGGTDLVDERGDGGALSLADIVPDDPLAVSGRPDGAGGVTATKVIRRKDARPVELQGPVSSHDPLTGNVGFLGIAVVAGTDIEFRNAAGNAVSRDAFMAAITDGVTVVKARGTFGSPPPIILANGMEIEPHR
jgi:hypothetical protein